MSSSPFRVERVDELYYRAYIDPSHHIFNGHFPGQPVVPGVCTIGMIKECVAAYLGFGVRFSTIKECKFVAAIIPTVHTYVDVEIVIKQELELTQVTAIVKTADGIVMKLKATANEY